MKINLVLGGKKMELEIKYQMSKQAFDSILSERTDSEKKQNPYQYVMDVINRQYGLKGKVTSLSII